MMTTTTASTTTPTNPMGFRTLTARFAGICRRCNGPIAVGDTIRYGGKGKTYHLSADCATPAPRPGAYQTPYQFVTQRQAQAAPLAPQQAQADPQASLDGLVKAMYPAAPITDQQIMSAALAATLQQTFSGLMAQAARLGDVEPRVVEAPAPAAAEAAAVEAAPEAEPVTVAAPVAVQAQTAPRPRQAARQRKIAPATMAQALDPDDLF